ncbi:MAG: DUF6519 domain-containing protein [Phormidesmis sp.]
MKGDFTRSTFRSSKHYSSVRMQQGRLQIDADWNEQADINAYLREAQALDMLVSEPASQAAEALILRGSSENRATMAAAPRTRPEGENADVFENFRLDPNPEARENEKKQGADIAIAPGHIYVDGVLCELTTPLSYLNQPDYPNAAAADLKEEGPYLAYLDVWQRHVTALDDPEIRERALTSVPDTATRVKTMWQIKLMPLSQDSKQGISLDEAIATLKDPKKGQLTITRSEQRNAAADSAQSMGNSLYRVEIHNSGPRGTATFKWSKNNGIVVARILEIANNTMTIENLAPDEVNRFSSGDWVEVIDTAHELRGEPGLLLRLTERTTNSKLVFDPATLSAAKDNPVAIEDFNPANSQNTFKVRRWEEIALSTDDAKLPMTLADSGFKISFPVAKTLESQSSEKSVRFYNTGDYWIIPVRSGEPDLPQLQSSTSANLSPQGIRHSKAPLALLNYKPANKETKTPAKFSLLQTQAEVNQDNTLPARGDYRLSFPALTRCLDSFGGVVQGSLEVQKNLFITQSRDEKGELVYGRLGVGLRNPQAGVHVEIKEPQMIGQMIKAAAQQAGDLQQWQGSNSYRTVVNAKGYLGLGVANPDSPLAVSGKIKLFDPDLTTINSQSFHGAIAFKSRELTLTAQAADQPLTLALSPAEKQFNFLGGALNVEKSVPNGEAQCFIAGKLTAEALQLGTSAVMTAISTDALTNNKTTLPTDHAVQSYVQTYVDGKVDPIERSVEELDLALKRETEFTIERFETVNGAIAANTQSIGTLLNQTVPNLQADISDINQTIDGAAPSGEPGLKNRIASVETAIEDLNAQSFVSQSALTGALLTKANIAGSNGRDFKVKNLVARHNLLIQTESPTDTALQTAARLQVQGFGESPFIVSGTLLPSKHEITTLEPLAAGDSITLASGETKLVTTVETLSNAADNTEPLKKVSLMPAFPSDLSENRFEYRRQSPIARFSDSTGTDQLTLTAQGNVVIGPIVPNNLFTNSPPTNVKLYVNGKVSATNITSESIAQLSSQTLKNNISDLSSQEAAVLLGQLNPVKFSDRADENQAIRTGFIAETVPDAVASADHQAVSPLNITAVLTKVIKDHHVTLARMSDIIQQQQTEIRSLNEKIARLSR